MASTVAEEIGLEGLPAPRHIDIRDRIQDSVTGVVYPDIDALEMVQGQAHNPINLLAIAHIASESQRALAVADPPAGGFRAFRIAREQHHTCAPIGKDFGNRLADAHGGASHDNDFP